LIFINPNPIDNKCYKNVTCLLAKIMVIYIMINKIKNIYKKLKTKIHKKTIIYASDLIEDNNCWK